jgi:type I restriction enzyme S subunit
MTSNPNGIEGTKKKITQSGLDNKRLELLSIVTLIYSIYGSIGKVNRLKIESTIHQGILGLFPNSKIENRYLEYYLKYIQDFVNILSSSNTQENLNLDKVKNIGIVIPPLQEQHQIVQFLDENTGLIDKLISTKERKITLLIEQRTSLINEVVTKGLNPNVKMKDSGVEWIGEIPEHWTIPQTKYITQIFRGKFTHRPRNDERFYNGEYPFIQTGDIVSSGKYLTKYTQTLNELGLSVSKEFPIGTLVMTISGNIGDVSILKIRSCFPDSILGFFPLSSTNVEYLYYLFTSLKQEFLKNSTVSTQMNLNVERVGSIQVPVPPIDEQLQIVEFLDSKTKEIDDLVQLEQKKIDLLKEYRQSLISEVVTGKVKTF